MKSPNIRSEIWRRSLITIIAVKLLLISFRIKTSSYWYEYIGTAFDKVIEKTHLKSSTELASAKVFNAWKHFIKLFPGNIIISYPLKTRKPKVFCCFQGVSNENICQKWLLRIRKNRALTLLCLVITKRSHMWPFCYHRVWRS